MAMRARRYMFTRLYHGAAVRHRLRSAQASAPSSPRRQQRRPRHAVDTGHQLAWRTPPNSMAHARRPVLSRTDDYHASRWACRPGARGAYCRFLWLSLQAPGFFDKKPCHSFRSGKRAGHAEAPIQERGNFGTRAVSRDRRDCRLTFIEYRRSPQDQL